MTERNICLINDSFPPAIDGVANAVTNYAEILTRNHARATVVTPSNPGADDSVFPFPVLRYPSIDMTKLVGYRAGLPFSQQMQKTLKDANLDLIHCHCPITSAMLARSLRDRINVPVVLTYHTKFDIDIANAIHAKFMQDEAKRFLVDNITACDEVWTVSRGAGENLHSLGYEGDYIVMPNGVDFPKGRVSAELSAAVGAAYDLPAGVPLFLFVGRMMWYKGLRIILDALKRLKTEGVSFRMVFVGGGADRDEIMAYSRGLGLDGCVFFAPAENDRTVIRAWYCRADLFLFPSTFDTNGLVVREAAACALASVLIAGSCAAEDVTDGESGFFIEENAASMAALLSRLCRNPAEMKRVGAGAQEQIYVSWDDAVSRAAARYEVVIDRYKQGLYPPHKRLSDEAFHAIAASLDALERGREHRLQFRDERLTLKEGRLSDIVGGRQRMKERWEDIIDRFL